jgi:Tol biopolymer transport system component
MRTATLLAAGLALMVGDSPRAATRLEGPRYLTFASNRAGGAGGWDIYLYDRAEQKLAPLPGLNGDTTEIHPCLSADARFVIFTSSRHVSKPVSGGVFVYDRQRGSVLDLPTLNAETTSGIPSVTAGGRTVAYTRFVSPQQYVDQPVPANVLLYDREKGRFSTPPTLNTPTSQHKFGGISGDGSLLAFLDSRYPEPHAEAIRLFDLRNGKDLGIVEFPAAVAPGDVSFPALNHDGRYLAFMGQPAGGAKDGDLFVYDRKERRLLDTPGLNSPQKEEFSSLSADGRFLAYETLRSGKWDIGLYDLQRKQAVELPGLNSDEKDRHPALSRED